MHRRDLRVVGGDKRLGEQSRDLIACLGHGQQRIDPNRHRPGSAEHGPVFARVEPGFEAVPCDGLHHRRTGRHPAVPDFLEQPADPGRRGRFKENFRFAGDRRNDVPSGQKVLLRAVL